MNGRRGNKQFPVSSTGEPMKFLTLADWTGMVETELFAQTYKSYGLATVRYPVLEVTATVEPFENGRGFSRECCGRASHDRNTREAQMASPLSRQQMGFLPPTEGQTGTAIRLGRDRKVGAAIRPRESRLGL
jgi:DNA polymerase III alpha subunit